MISIKKYIVNGLTLVNAACGSISIMLALEGNYIISSYFLIAGILADQLDGRFARYLKQTSHIGKELDSLADAVSFGVAPMILLYSVYLKSLGVAGIAVSAILVLCAIYRLAKFNVCNVNEHFLGVPTPVSAGIAIGLVIGNVQLPALYIALIVIALSYLMVSKIPFYNFKNLKNLKSGEKAIIFIESVVFIAGILLYPNFVILFAISAYLLLVPILWFFD